MAVHTPAKAIDMLPLPASSSPARHTAAAAHDHALVLGASGAAGAAIASRLTQMGMRVTLAGRGTAAPRMAPYPSLATLAWRQVDVLQPGALRLAARDCGVIVHAANPANYVGWHQQLLPMLDAVLDAAAHPEVTVVLPGNVYALQPSASAIGEDTPQPPASTAKGRLRQAMEARLQAAAEAGRCRALIVRAGDFFGAHAPHSWMTQAMLPALARPDWPAATAILTDAAASPTPTRLAAIPRVRRIWQPGAPGVGHQWAYLEDFSLTVGLLLNQRGRLPRHAVFHTSGHWDADGQTLARRMADLLAQASGQRPRIQPFPWWALRLAAPVHPLSRELLEMRWLWDQPVRLSNARLCEVLGREEPHTPWNLALRAALHLG
jgi:nucleoside-diphosphate-sugar epimerase